MQALAREIDDGAGQAPAPHPVLLMYLGRRGISQIVYDIAAGFDRSPAFRMHLALSRQNESLADFSAFGAALTAVETFDRGWGALDIARLLRLRRWVRKHVTQNGIRSVISLMPHVWSGALVGAVQQAGARYFTIVHDARPHPGDRTGLVHALLMRDACKADGVFTLSRHVTSALHADGRIDPERITTLFLPNTGSMRTSAPAMPGPGEPWRFLFLGRLMAYKGLPLFIEAMEILARAGHRLSLSVMGEGDIAAVAPRLETLGAHVVNRWLTAEEMAEAYTRHHAVVLSHVEASQSGVASAAIGAGIPVVALPVGGVAEQVHADLTGVLANAPDAEALAAALRRFMNEPGLYQRVLAGSARYQSGHSVDRFVEGVAKVIC